MFHVKRPFSRVSGSIGMLSRHHRILSRTAAASKRSRRGPQTGRGRLLPGAGWRIRGQLPIGRVSCTSVGARRSSYVPERRRGSSGSSVFTWNVMPACNSVCRGRGTDVLRTCGAFHVKHSVDLTITRMCHRRYPSRRVSRCDQPRQRWGCPVWRVLGVQTSDAA